jgi:protein OPY2
VFGYLHHRRREAAKEATAKEQANAEVKPDIPARADAVLSRPDPHFGTHAPNPTNSEKLSHHAGSTDATELGTVRVYNNQSDTTINLDPSHASRRQSATQSARSNPFADGVSIQTASDRTQSTNVIPIALVPPGGHPPDPLSHSRAGTPSRPVRSPELTLNDTNHLDLDHIAVSDSEIDASRQPYASSTRSGVSGRSFMTTSSTATDLDEAPTILTPKQGVVRQVLGISQAQVVRVPSNGSSLGGSSAPFSKQRGGRAGQNVRNAAERMSKGAIGRSPLAKQSFTPADIPLANREPSSPTSTVVSRGNPFTDSASPYRASFADSSRTTDTLGSPTDYHTEGPYTPRPGTTFTDGQVSRPVSSVSTADGVSIRADIGTASRVILGMQSPAAYTPSTLSPGFGLSPGSSMQANGGRIVTSVDRDDDEESVRPHSILSAKTTSSHADSVLAGFPFVPPSPISALPPRSPGATSPNNSPSSAGSMFARQQVLNKPTSSSPPVSPTSTVATQATVRPNQVSHQPPPIPRPNFNGLAADRAASTFSTSTASGLETYPFQFGGQPVATPTGHPRQSNRASLDTLALSRVLAAFPLEHESTSYGEDQKLGK